MGKTTTTNLALIKPDTAESIQANLPTFDGWATQNGANCDTIDALFRHTSTHTWTPTWTADTTNPTLGSGGFVSGKYIRLFPKMLIGYIQLFTGGAGFATGSGLYQLTPPATLAPELALLHNFIPIGKYYLHDNDTVANCTVGQVMYELTGNLLTFKKHDGDSWRSSTPFVPAQNDRMTCYFIYPTTDA